MTIRKAGYPKYFESIDHARSWLADFIDWYNNRHWHSGMQYITPMQKRKGLLYQIFEARNRTLFNAKEKFPSRWGEEGMKLPFSTPATFRSITGV